MKSKPALISALFMGFAVDAPASDIYRCKSAGGTVSYQQQPCSHPGEGHLAGIATVYPDHTAERDRLMQRVAAMDARLIKRLEIEAAERIARDERIAREAALQAERERAAREQAQSAPVVIIGWPQRQGPPQRRHWNGRHSSIR